MPSNKPQTRDPARPAAKARAVALKAQAARVMPAPAQPPEPFPVDRCPPGFVPYPFGAPQSFTSIPTMLKVEAARLLDIAQDEFERLSTYNENLEPAQAVEIRETHRWQLGLDDLGRLVERRDGRPETAETRPDPALKAIAAHRAAYRAWEPHLGRITEMVTGTPEFAAAEADGEPARVAEETAFAKLFEEWPVTLAGLLALADYLPGAIMQNGRSQPDDDGVTALDAVCFALKNLARRGRIMADTCPLPAPKPTPFAPAGLADACDWAMRHLDWFNSGQGREGWDDDQSDVELDKYSAVYERAVFEPARSLHDLAALAQLVRQDWLNEHPTEEETGPARERLTLKILREVIAFAEDGPADTLADRILTHWREYDAAPDEGPVFEASQKKRWELLEEAADLSPTPESIPAKSAALAWVTYSWSSREEREQGQIDVRLARDIRQAASAGPATAAQRAASPIPESVAALSSDPVHAAIAASRAAEAAMAEFGRQQGGRPGPATAADFAEEERLCAIQTATRDTALATVPTTRAGQLAMLDYVRFQMGLFGNLDGTPPDTDMPIWRDTHKALQAALGADIEAESQPQIDLSGCDLHKLQCLYVTLQAVWHHLTAETQAPWCWDEAKRNHNAAGDLLDAEGTRLARITDAIAAEARGRPAGDQDAREYRLGTLVLHELTCEGRIADRTVQAEIIGAWEARARG